MAAMLSTRRLVPGVVSASASPASQEHRRPFTTTSLERPQQQQQEQATTSLEPQPRRQQKDIASLQQHPKIPVTEDWYSFTEFCQATRISGAPLERESQIRTWNRMVCRNIPTDNVRMDPDQPEVFQMRIRMRVESYDPNGTVFV